MDGAPTTSNFRKYRLPIFETRPSRSFPPDEFCQKGHQFRYAHRGYWPCGGSPRLRMQLGATALRSGASHSGLLLVLSLGLEGKVADHATFLKNRHGRFRDSDASAIPSVVPVENIRWPS